MAMTPEASGVPETALLAHFGLANREQLHRLGLFLLGHALVDTWLIHFLALTDLQERITVNPRSVLDSDLDADRMLEPLILKHSDGTFLKQLIKADTMFARDLALSPDPAQQFLYVGNGQDIVIVDRTALEIVGTIAVPGMIGGGHHLATDSKGNLYIAQTGAGMQKLRFTGMSAAR